MRLTRFAATFALAAALALPAAARPAKHPAAPARHNVIIFVADGLRYDSVTPQTAPTIYALRHAGVDFTNSHSIYPTVTTANASAIATGHYLGDTGDYANTLWFGYPVQAKGGTPLTFFEDDGVLRDVKAHFGDDYLGETSLLVAARAAGMATAVIGKIGPAAIQDITSMTSGDGIVVDDAANYPIGLDGRPTGFVKIGDDLARRIKDAGLSDKAPLTALPGKANVEQQAYMTDVTVKALLPLLKERGTKGFALLYWCRDPDATQHNQEDNVGALTPGINGPTGHAGIADADAQLKRILDALKSLGLDKTTDVFVTADHGFSTISHSLPTDDGGIQPASMPQGFVAIDIAKTLGTKLFDPDADMGEILFEEDGTHPSRGSALIGPSADKPLAIVAANGGSDLVYIPGGIDVAKTVYARLLAAPYTGALFVNDDLLKQDPAAFAGALPMSAVNLLGASHVPNPSIVIGFRSWVAKGCTLGDLLCTVEIADTGLHTGQGMHGSSSRADTRNFMAAVGPDFKKAFADPSPVSNADINPTLAHILGLQIKPHGNLTGRAATEALAGGKPVKATSGTLAASQPGPGGATTLLNWQAVGNVRYFDAAGFAGRIVGLKAK